MAIPKEFGGFGLTLAEAGRETRRLARHAPATALCINMHNYWVRTAADVWRSGDKSAEWILKEAAAGEVFAAGHGVADMVVELEAIGALVEAVHRRLVGRRRSRRLVADALVS
jgi:hypothetical protein